MPARLASYVGAIAGLTGWTLEFILWELPLAAGLQFQHCALVQKGIVTVATDESLLAMFDDLSKEITDGGDQSQAGAG